MRVYGELPDDIKRWEAHDSAMKINELEKMVTKRYKIQETIAMFKMDAAKSQHYERASYLRSLERIIKNEEQDLSTETLEHIDELAHELASLENDAIPTGTRKEIGKLENGK